MFIFNYLDRLINRLSSPLGKGRKWLTQRVQMTFWQSRTVVAFLGLTYVAFCYTFFYNNLIGYYFAFTTAAKSPPYINLIYVIWGILAMFCLDFYTRRINAKALEDPTRKRIPTFFNRVFALLPYYWLLVTYTQELMFALDPMLREDHMNYLIQIYVMIRSFRKIPFLNFGQSHIFIAYFLYFCIIRNPKGFPYFVRYHVAQVLTLDLFFYVILNYFSFFLEGRSLRDWLVMQIGYQMYIYFFFIICVGVVTALIGVQTRIPFLHDAIRYHIGLNEDNERDYL